MNNKLCLGLLAGVSGAYLLRRLGMRWGATDDKSIAPYQAMISYPIPC